jgi:hypothetical protein
MGSADDVTELLRVLSAPRRNNYFYGKRLDVPHFRMEQDYGKQKRWLLNRLALGAGVLCGLEVSKKDGQLCVSPGVAIDGLGREIIVPLQSCIDPWAPPPACCSDQAQPAKPVDKNASRTISLWLCYRECLTDLMPTLVSDCKVRQECAPGTIVETFMLKVTEGAPSAKLADPDWCAKLHQTSPPSKETGGDAPPAPKESVREILCGLFDKGCESPPADPCILLAVVELRNGEIQQIDNCAYRPRVYSNAILLELILCLALRVEECCAQHPAPPPHPTFKVSSVAILGDPGNGTAVTMSDPTKPLIWNHTERPRSIRVHFNDAVAINTVTAGDTYANHSLDPETFSFLVFCEAGEDQSGSVVNGTISQQGLDTVQFDIHDFGPWDFFIPGVYKVTLFGDPDPAKKRPAILSKTGARLDGEPTQLPSGNGRPGGNFVFTLSVES